MFKLDLPTRWMSRELYPLFSITTSSFCRRCTDYADGIIMIISSANLWLSAIGATNRDWHFAVRNSTSRFKSSPSIANVITPKFTQPNPKIHFWLADETATTRNCLWVSNKLHRQDFVQCKFPVPLLYRHLRDPEHPYD